MGIYKYIYIYIHVFMCVYTIYNLIGKLFKDLFNYSIFSMHFTLDLNAIIAYIQKS